jgi:lauroyl/myristoyl acyltransferase
MVLPAVVARTAKQQLHRVILAKPFFVSKTADKEGDLQKAASDYAAWFTRWLRKRPDHYAPYLLLRRKVRHTDGRPFFDDYSG